MRAYLLTFLGAATLFSAYGAVPSFSTSTKTILGAPFTQGDTGDIYVINIITSAAATNGSTVTVTDTLPTGLTHPVIKLIPPGYTCGISGLTITCTNSSVLTKNEDDMLVFEVDVSKTAPAAPFSNSVTISGGGATTFTADGPTQAITQEPYLTITKTQTSPAYKGNPLPVAPGQSLTYKIDVDNIGGAPTTGTVTVVDTLASDMLVSSVSGNGGWTCHHTPTVVTCTATSAIPAAVGTTPGEAPNIIVTAVVLGSNASDVASVTFTSTVNLVTGPTTNTTQAVTSTVTPAFTNVTFTSSSGEPNVEVDGTIYVSGITLPEDLTLNHTINATTGCSIFGATNFITVETQPFTPTGPWSEITGQITGPVVAIDCQ